MSDKELLMPEERNVLLAVNSFFFLLVSLPYAVAPYNYPTVDLGLFTLDMIYVRIAAIIGVVIQLWWYYMIWRWDRDRKREWSKRHERVDS